MLVVILPDPDFKVISENNNNYTGNGLFLKTLGIDIDVNELGKKISSEMIIKI